MALLTKKQKKMTKIILENFKRVITTDEAGIKISEYY
jgi:hypothetical protein